MLNVFSIKKKSVQHEAGIHFHKANGPGVSWGLPLEGADLAAQVSETP